MAWLAARSPPFPYTLPTPRQLREEPPSHLLQQILPARAFPTLGSKATHCAGVLQGATFRVEQLVLVQEARIWAGGKPVCDLGGGGQAHRKAWGRQQDCSPQEGRLRHALRSKAGAFGNTADCTAVPARTH